MEFTLGYVFSLIFMEFLPKEHAIQFLYRFGPGINLDNFCLKSETKYHYRNTYT